MEIAMLGKTDRAWAVNYQPVNFNVDLSLANLRISTGEAFVCLLNKPIASSNAKKTCFPFFINSTALFPIHLKPVNVSCW